MKLICFYLPQFHPISENDEWWGPGFTEWTSVASARPRFPGHHQPQIPADLGFYDLRLEDTRIAQAKLAAKFGIGGFCYYHYWFNGKRLLSRPLDAMLASKRPDFPFCLCWANENWTRAWDGLEREILIGQSYSTKDYLDHIRWLMNVFSDSRYILVEGKPLFLVYRLDNIPDVQTMISLWRQIAMEHGFKGIYFCAVKNGFVSSSDKEILNCGFDAIVDFQPNRRDFPPATDIRALAYKLLRSNLPDKIYQKIKLSVTANNIINYKRMVAGLISREWPSDYCKFPCAFPSWDNSARRKSATIIQNDNPVEYGTLLSDCIRKVKRYNSDEQIVFINAWNEWAEGCHLEPDLRFGTSFLEITQQVASEKLSPSINSTKLIFNLSMLGSIPTGMGIYSQKCAEAINDSFECLVVSSSNHEKTRCHLPSPENIVIGAKNGAALKRFLYSWKGFPKQEGLIFTPTHHGVLRSQKQIIAIHDLIPIHYPLQNLFQYIYFKFILPKIIKNAVAVFTVSEQSKNEIANYYSIPGNKIFVIPNGVDSKRFAPKLIDNPEGKEYLLVVGASYPHKNVHELINNCELWRGRYRLKIIGEQGSYSKYLQKLVRKKNLTEEVDFIGYVPEDALIHLYQECKALVFPSLCEGFGIPPLEAMACGRPVISSDISVLKEIGKDVPIYVTLGDSGSWKLAFDQLKNENIINNKIACGLELVKSYTWIRSGSILVKTLLEIEPSLKLRC